MADIQDVENALADMLAAAIYPNGTSQPSLIGVTVQVQRGWPTEAQVQKAVTANSVLITVHGDRGMARDTTRYFRDFQSTAIAPTISATVSGSTITFAETVSVGHALAVRWNGTWFSYLVQPSDTLATIAAAFAAEVPDATSSGAVLILAAGGPSPQARVVRAGTTSAEVSRQRLAFRVSCWAPTPALRDSVFTILPGVVAYTGSRLPLPDGTHATWFGQQESGPDDIPGRANEWRRDVVAAYEFGVSYAQTAMALLLLETTVTANGQTVFSAGDQAYPDEALTDGSGNPLVDAAGTLLGQV